MRRNFAMVAPYRALKERFEKIKSIDNASAILSADQQTVMPKNSAQDRQRQLVTLSDISHDLLVAPEVGQWLDKAEKLAARMKPEDRRNLALMRRDYIEETALSAELVKRKTLIEAVGDRLHTKFRKRADYWPNMRDQYAKSFDLAHEIGEATKGPLGKASVYEALLDPWTAGLSEDTVTKGLTALKESMPGLIKAAMKRQKHWPALPLKGPFPAEQQKELALRIVKAMGFDQTRGRLDFTKGHPQSGGSAGDTRFTANINEENFLDTVFTVKHETGHAKYEQDLPEKWRYQPAGSSIMGIHETQSRIMEIYVGHTPEFFQWLEVQARDVFKRPDDKALDAKNLERLSNTVQPSLIRIEADEMTYPMHIVLRWEIEKAMIEGKMKVDDIGQAWNDGMKTLLGITPPDVIHGHGQDVHWPVGYVGYFPVYTLGGDMGAAQFFAAAERDNPNLRAEIAKGNFAPITDWLRDNVHSKGSLLTVDELFEQATGEKLNAKYYIAHMKERYLGETVKVSPPARAPKPSP
jgi:carboxypeptidase Taq